jgi:hypothetical protein
MGSFKINTDSQMPSESYIQQNKKGFDQVLGKFKGFKPTVIQKTWFFGGSAALVTTVAVLTGIFVIQPALDPNGDLPGDTLKEQTAFVDNPLDVADVPYSTFNVDVSSVSEIECESGTRIRVPENAFCDDRGNPVQGPVQMKFREFHNVMDIFKSGIPMTYDSAGIPYTFESAGMFDIRAFQGDKPLQLMKNKEIEVDLVAFNPDPKFNLYFLDTNKGNWQYLSESNFEMDEPVDNIMQDETQPTVSMDRYFNEVPPVTPVKATNKNNIIKAPYDKELFPEFMIYDKVVFEVDPNKSKFDTDLLDVVWTEIKLKRSKQQGYYILHLNRPDTAIRLYVQPVFMEGDYKDAMNKYNKDKQKKSAVGEDRNRKSDSIVGDRRTDQLYRNDNYLVATLNGDAPAFVTVRVPQMGYFNCDYPVPRSFSLTPTFTENGNVVTPQKIYTADLTMNALFESAGTAKMITCVKRSAIVLWVVMDDQRIAVVPSDAFEKAIRGTASPVFELHFLDAHTGLEILQRAMAGEVNIEMPEASAEVTKEVEVSSDKEADYTINAQAETELKCFPNPAVDRITVKLPVPAQERSTLYFVNASGALIDQMQVEAGSTEVAANIGDWDPGVYFCKLESSQGSSKIMRFVKSQR